MHTGKEVAGEIKKTEHTLVAQSFAVVRLSNKKVSFPLEVPEIPLLAEDYLQFIKLLNEKFKPCDIPNRLQELYLSCFDQAVLQALDAESGTYYPFKALTLDFKDLAEDKNTFISKLLATVTKLSESNITELQLVDPNQWLDKTDIERLTEHVQKNKIALNINLPKQFSSTPEQKAIDIATCDPLREKNIAAYNATIPPNAIPVIDPNRVKRTRGINLSGANLGIDIELQQAQQQQQQAEASVAVNAAQISQAPNGENENQQVYSFTDFVTAFDKGMFSESYNISYPLGTSRLWMNWVGALSINEASSVKSLRLSKPAIEILLKHHDKFLYGIDLNNLPDGFVLRVIPGSQFKVLDFDGNLQQLSIPSPLKVQLNEVMEAKPLPITMVQKWIGSNEQHPFVTKFWNVLDNSAYDKNAYQNVLKHFPTLTLLTQDELDQLKSLCFVNDKLQPQILNFLMENPIKLKAAKESGGEAFLKQLNDIFPDAKNKEIATKFINNFSEKKNIFSGHIFEQLLADKPELLEKVTTLVRDLPDVNLIALMQLYIDRDEVGMNNFIALVNKNPVLMKHLDKYIFSKNSRYTDIIEADFLEVINAIEGFGPTERLWWDTLFKQHCTAQTEVNLVDLVKAFKAFNFELAQIVIPGGTLTLPGSCELIGIKSLPVALSRILTLLKHCEKDNRQAQLTCVSQLDLSSNGMIKPITASNAKTWGFITPEMKINAAYETNDYQSNAIRYFVVDYWKAIYSQTFIDENLDNTIIKFFRYVAVHEKNAQLPMDFYQYAHQQLTVPDFEFNLLEQKYLYALIAGATTDRAQVKQIDEKKAKKMLDGFLLKIKKSIGLPGFNSIVRQGILFNLVELKLPPPLPIMEQLVSLIFSCVTSPSHLSRLKDANDNLVKKVGEFGSALYSGLKDYTDKSFRNKELFFSHLDTLNEISKRIKNLLMQKLTVALISSFNLESSDIYKISDCYDLFDKKTPLAEILIMLGDLSTKGKDPLTAKDFFTILNTLQEIQNNDTAAKDIVHNFKLDNGQYLSDYFPREKLELYGKDSTEIKNEFIDKLINGGLLKSQAEKILKAILRFKKPEKNETYDEVIQNCIDICNKLDTSQKERFINKLTNQEGLYDKRITLGSKEDYFIPLLESIKKLQATEDFIDFLITEKLFIEQCTPDQIKQLYKKDVLDEKPSPGSKQYYVKNLAQKAELLISSLLLNVQDADFKALSLIDLTQRLQMMLLQSQVGSLSLSDVTLEEDQFYNAIGVKFKQNLQQLEKGKDKDLVIEDPVRNAPLLVDKELSIDIDALSQIVSNFIQNVKPSSELMIKYQGTITSLQEDETFTEEEGQRFTKIMQPFLVKYFMSPEQLEASLSQAMETHLKKHPELAKKKDFIIPLLNNPIFLKELRKEEILKAAEDSNILDNKEKMDLIINALVKDLTKIENFEQQTKDLAQEIESQQKNIHLFSNVSVRLFKKIDQIIADNPAIKGQFLALYDRYLISLQSPQVESNLLTNLFVFVSQLETSFSSIEDKNIVLSLCVLFNGEKPGDLQPNDLIKLLKLLHTKEIIEHKDLILKIFINDPELRKDKESHQKIKEFVKLMTQSPEFSVFINTVYENAPFPSITKMTGWYGDDEKSKNYEAFDKEPFKRESERNGFKIDHAINQLEKFKINSNEIGVGSGKFIYQKEDIDAFEGLCLDMRTISTKDLLTALKQYKTIKSTPNYSRLIAIAAELLYRSQGEELNTTQYLALYASLQTEGHVTCEIGTGEGKTREMMTMICCQYALGKAVDFLTSDVQLATRDFVNYQPYFNMIGANSAMIYADTPPEFYQKEGINFSDPSNFSLFRNKARSKGQEHLIIAEESKRCLLLDEADKSYFDMANTRFNYSIEGDESIKGMTWVYPLLMDYFTSSNETVELYYSDVDASREAFKAYAAGKCDKIQLSRLKLLSNEQIEQWQVSAVTAKELQINKDFAIEPDKLILTPFGPKFSSEAQLLFGNRIARNSKYSFGVHQCLHARLNSAKHNPVLVASDVTLTEALQQCENDFYIPDEKQIVYSSTSKNLLDDYKNGILKAVTGTAGSDIEREEANKLYQNMKFIEIPRHSGLNRRDRAIRLVKNHKQQVATLISQIKEAQAKNQPILIICTDDLESEQLFDELKKVFTTAIQRIDSLIGDKEEEMLNIAGNPGQITVSTDMIGRGTDIKLNDKSKDNGLNVMLTYLPRVRDLHQILGRAARQGSPGETSIILDKELFKKRLGKTTLTDGYYRDAEHYIQREQAKMDRREQCSRLIKHTVGDFRQPFTQKFSHVLLPEVDAKHYIELVPLWTNFWSKSDKLWNVAWTDIQKILLGNQVQTADLEPLLKKYDAEVLKLWNGLEREVTSLNLVDKSGEPIDAASLLSFDEKPKLTLSESTTSLLKKFELNAMQLSTKLYTNFDPGHEGRAVQYESWTIPFIASLKGYANLLPFVNFSDARRPFANIRSWNEGHGRLFPDLRANPGRWKWIGAGGFALLGAGIGGALIATGVLAPFGFAVLGLTVAGPLTSAIILGAAGLFLGGLMGLFAGWRLGATLKKQADLAMKDGMVPVADEPEEPEEQPEARPAVVEQAELEQPLGENPSPRIQNNPHNYPPLFKQVSSPEDQKGENKKQPGNNP